MAYKSDCFIEICNTHAINFGSETYFFSRFTFKLHLHEMRLFDYYEYNDQEIWW